MGLVKIKKERGSKGEKGQRIFIRETKIKKVRGRKTENGYRIFMRETKIKKEKGRESLEKESGKEKSAKYTIVAKKIL